MPLEVYQGLEKPYDVSIIPVALVQNYVDIVNMITLRMTESFLFISTYGLLVVSISKSEKKIKKNILLQQCYTMYYYNVISEVYKNDILNFKLYLQVRCLLVPIRRLLNRIGNMSMGPMFNLNFGF